MANPSRGIISPAFVKCWTASPVISCIIIRKPPRALASKKAAGSFKTGPRTFRSCFPLGRILPKQTFFYKPAPPSFSSRRGFVIPVSPASAADNCLHFASFEGDCPSTAPYARMQQPGNPDADRKRPPPPGPVFFIETFTLHHIPYKSPPAYSPTRFLTAWTESAPVGFCMLFPNFIFQKRRLQKL